MEKKVGIKQKKGTPEAEKRPTNGTRTDAGLNTSAENSPIPNFKETLATLHRELSVVSDSAIQRSKLLLCAVRARYKSAATVRVPLYMAVSRTVDSVALRQLVGILFGAPPVGVQFLSQAQITRLFSETNDCLVLDLVATNDRQRTSIEGLVKARSIPGSKIMSQQKVTDAKKEQKQLQVRLVPMELQGETILMLADGCLGDGYEALVVELHKEDVAPAEIGDIAKIESACQSLVKWAQNQTFNIDRSDLPPSRYVGAVTRRGFLLLAAIAKALDRVWAEGRFLDAIKEAWTEVEARARQALSEHDKELILCRRVLDYLQDKENTPDYNGGYRLDRIAASIMDLELFPKLDEAKLGRIIRKLRIYKSISRHRFENLDISFGPSHVYRTYAVFDMTKLDALAQKAAELVKPEEL